MSAGNIIVGLDEVADAGLKELMNKVCKNVGVIVVEFSMTQTNKV